MRVPHSSLSARLLAVLVTLLLVFGPGSAAIAQTEEGDGGVSTSAAETSAETAEATEAPAADATADGGDTMVTDDAAADADAEEAAAVEETEQPATEDAADAGQGDEDGVVVITSQPEDSSSSGANDDGPYTSDPDAPETPSGNGNDDNNGQQPCAGCVGDADDKNPPGQLPGPEDPNAGYECDENSGVGPGNPAHTGCTDAPAGDPSISLDKVASVDEAELGDVVSYQFTVTNTGDVDLVDVTIDDPDLGITDQVVPLGADGVLTPGEAVTVTASKTHTITQADVDAGEFVNVATVTGEDEDGTTVTDDGTDTVTVEGPGNIDVDFDCEGFTVTSDKDISNIIIEYRNADGTLGTFKLDGLSGKTFSGNFADYIPAGATVTAVYVKSGANHSGDYPGAGERFEFSEACDAEITLVKTGVQRAEIAEEITYEFLVTNTGDVRLTNVTLTDPLLGGPIELEETTLDPDDFTTGTATYTVDVDDIGPDGKLRNTATTTGTPPSGPDVSDTDDHVVDISPFGEAGIQIVKTGPATGVVGQPVTYTMEVTNTEEQRLFDVVVTDPSCDAGTLTGPVKTGGDLDRSLEPGEVWTYTCTRVMQPGDVPSHTNVATVVANSVLGPVTDNDDHVVTIAPAPVPAISLDKEASVSTAEVGDQVLYSFAVTNTGEVDLINVVVDDARLGISDLAVTTTANPVLSVGETITVLAPNPYTVTDADLQAGEVENTAITTGETEDGAPVTDDDKDVVEVTDLPGSIIVEFDCTGFKVTSSKDISNLIIVLNTNGTETIITLNNLGKTFTYTAPDGSTVVRTFVKSGDNASGGLPGHPGAGQQFTNNAVCDIDLVKEGPDSAVRGETITYDFTVTNTGTETLTNVTLTDPMLGGTIPLPAAGVTLSPDEVVTVSRDYTVTAADETRGTIHNVANVVGTPPAGPDVSDTDPHDVDVPRGVAGDRPGISLIKDGPATANEDETITYTFEVRNTGNVTLTDVHVTDPLLGNREIVVTPSTLAPDAVGEAEATYTVTEANALDGEVYNEATATGTPPTGPDVEDDDDHTVEVPLTPPGPEPDIELTKLVSAEEAEVGDVIEYSFRVRNTGNVILTNVHITDPLLGAGVIAVRPSTLDPGEIGVAGPIAYTVTEADGEAGKILNTAVATGTPPTGPPVEDEDEAETIVEEPPVVPPADNPGIRLVKQGPATAQRGDTVTYTFTVTNTGNVALSDVHITDPLLGLDDLAVTPSTLAAGESGTATATYTVRGRDVRRGFILNTATAVGTPPDGPPVSDDDDHRIEVPATPPGTPPGTPPATPPTPELPATGSDALAQLLAGMMALLLGMFLVRRSSTLQTAAAYSPDANGFARRRPQAADGSAGRGDHRGSFRRRT